TNSDVVFLALGTLSRPYMVASTLPRDQIAPALINDNPAIRVLATDSTGRQLSANVAGEHLIGLAGPLRSAGGDLYGAFVPFRSRDAELAGFRALRRTVGLAIGLGVLLALVLAFVLARQIALPVRRLVVATRRVQDG